MEISVENLYVDFGSAGSGPWDKGGGGRAQSSRLLDKGVGRSPNNFFRPFGPQFRLKIRGEGGPRSPPLDAPLLGDYRIRSSKEPSPRHHTNICKISQLAELYLHLLRTYHFQIKLPVLLILRRFFQWCPRCFPNWSMSKVKNRGSSKAKNGILFDWKVMLILSLKDFINMCYECKCIFFVFYW